MTLRKFMNVILMHCAKYVIEATNLKISVPLRWLRKHLLCTN